MQKEASAKLLADYRAKFLGNAPAKPSKRYTGDQMLGIATMHKSNAVPVFSVSTAKSISQMK